MTEKLFNELKAGSTGGLFSQKSLSYEKHACTRAQTTVVFHISYILGGSPFSNEADFQGALHLTTNNKFNKQLKVKDTT